MSTESPTSGKRSPTARTPDATIRNAIDSVHKNRHFKRMMVFGLRSLSDKCVPPTPNYKENSQTVLHSELKSFLAEAPIQFEKDEEVFFLLSKVYFGISEYLKTASETDEFVIDAIGGLVKHGVQDETTLKFVLDSLSNLSRPSSAIVNGLLLSLTAKSKPLILARVLETIYASNSSFDNPDEAMHKIFSSINNRDQSNPDNVRAIVSALNICEMLAHKLSIHTQNVNLLVGILNSSAKSCPTILKAGANALGAMVGPQELKECLDSLKTAPEGSTERANALTMLGSMSYISSCADQIAQAGGIPLLVDVINHSAENLKQGDVHRGLIGAANILASVGKKDGQRQAIIQAGGIKALTETLKTARNDPEVVSNCFNALESLIANQVSSFIQAEKLGLLTEIANSLQNHEKNPDVISSGLSLLNKCGEVGNVQHSVSVSLLLDTIFRNKANSLIVLASLKCLEQVVSAKSVIEFKNFNKYLPTIMIAADRQHLAESVIHLIETIVPLDYEKSLVGSSVVDTTFAAMLELEQGNSYLECAKYILKELITQKDMLRTVKSLETALFRAQSDPENGLKHLAAVNGLSQIPSLASGLVDHDVRNIIAKSYSIWINGSYFTERQKIIRTAAQCFSAITSKTKPDSNLAREILNVLQISGLKSLQEKQGDAVSNSLVDISQNLEALCRCHLVTDLGAIVEGILRCMRKYPDCRYAQNHFINCLNLISLDPEGRKKVIESGSLTSVVKYMNKVSIYEEIQFASVKLFITLAKNGNVESLRSPDVINGIHNAGRRFAFLQPQVTELISLLIPKAELEKMISEAIKDIDVSLKSNKLASAADRFQQLNQYLSSAEAVKIAAKYDIGKLTNSALLTGDPEIQVQAAECSAKVSENSVGLNNLIKNSAIKSLISLYEQLKKGPADEKMAINVLKVSRRIMRSSPEARTVAVKQNFHTRIVQYIGNNPESGDLVAETAATIATMSSEQAVIQDNKQIQNFIGDICSRLLIEEDPRVRSSLIKALDQFVLDPDAHIVDIVVRNKAIEGLFRAIRESPNDWPTIHRSYRTLQNIDKFHKLGEYSTKSKQIPPQQIVTISKTVIRTNLNKAKACENSLKIINSVTHPTDKQILNDTDLPSEIGNILTTHPEDKEILKVCNILLGKMGADTFINSYMKQVMDICKDKPTEYLKQVETINKKLAVYLPADVIDENKTFEHTSKYCDDMADILLSNKDKPALICSVAQTSKKLAKRFGNKKKSIINPLETKIMPVMFRILSDENCPRNLLISGFECMAEFARCPAMQLKVVAQAADAIQPVLNLLDKHGDDSEVVAAILEFLDGFSNSDAGAATLLSTQKGTSRRFSGSIPAGICALMNQYSTSRCIMEHGFNIIGNLADTPVRDIEDLGKTPVGLAGMMSCRRKMIKKLSPEENNAALSHCVERFNNLGDDTSPEDLEMCVEALAQYTEAMVDGDLKIGESGALEALLNITDDPAAKSLGSLSTISRSLAKAAANDSEGASKILRRFCKPLMESTDYNVMLEDPLCVSENLKMLNAIAGHPGNAQAIGEIATLESLLTNAHEVIDGDLEGVDIEQMKLDLESLKNKIEDDKPENLTLRLVLGKWTERKALGEQLLIGGNDIVDRYIDFVCNYTMEYSKENMGGMNSELGAEYHAGCECYKLAHELSDNNAKLLERNDENVWVLHAIGKQRDEEVVQCTVSLCVEALKSSENRDLWSSVENAAAISGDCVLNGRNNLKDEQKIITRMNMVELLCGERSYYNGTRLMEGLIGLWDDFDKGKFSVEVLKQVFKTMRKIVNDHWVGIILKNNVPQRLINFVDDKHSRIDLLPDVLFLLATLAVVPEIKTMIGELNGVESCLELLSRSMNKDFPLPQQLPGYIASPKAGRFRSKAAPTALPTEGLSPVQTNNCLALSAITLSHSGNVQRFINNKGLELNIQAMQFGITGNTLDYDVANAASLLMCNTCFRRDELKELYGKKDACESVMRIINFYDGTEDSKAFRCLATMFKAIGNLALFTPNVDIFMKGKIEKTFSHLYEKSSRLPDGLIEASLRTLSNLAMENKAVNIEKFSICMKPILSMLKQEQRTSIRMFGLAFDVLSSLCRLGDNSKIFLKENGISCCLRILNSYSDDQLYRTGIHVLGIQTTNPESIQPLVDAGIFDFLTSIVQSGVCSNESDIKNELLISSQRCTRRLLKCKKHAEQFISAGGLEQITALLNVSDPANSMVHMECHRTIINLLTLFPPSISSNKMVDDFDEEEIPDELNVHHGIIQCHEKPRSWECLQLNSMNINQIITGTIRSLTRTASVKQARFTRSAVGLLAYFACEKIPDTIQTWYDNQFTEILASVLEICDQEPDIPLLVCYVLNNVAYASEPKLYVQLRHDKNLRKNLDSRLPNLPSSQKAFCTLTLKLINEKSADSLRFEIHQQWNIPYELTQWDKDKYPNGVQDLSQDVKEELRLGGKFKTIVNNREKEILHWKSSLDLLSLYWRVHEKEGPWQHIYPISRFYLITKGLESQTLETANKLMSATSRPRDSECIVMLGPASEDFPDGVELNIICSGSRSRDRILELFREWREAATFGF